MNKFFFLRISSVIVVLAATTALAQTARVDYVFDGDTIAAVLSGKIVRVRLCGIDAPEKEQKSGQAAKRQLAELLMHKNIRLEIITTDKYGRAIANIFADEKNINLSMIENGAAWLYRRYAGQCWRPETLQYAVALENQARQSRRGLWRFTAPIPPWQFRALTR